MRHPRQSIGGLGNLMFKQAYLIGALLRGEIPDVYVQGTGFWGQFKEQIRTYFSEDIKPIDKVAIHIRRGDYKQADHFHVDLSTTDYYQKAVQYFPNESFLVFCKDNQDWRDDLNDQEWCKQFLDTFIPGRYEMRSVYHQEHEDMNTMAGCKGLIGANSSFSWWAAFLGDKARRIIFPKQWFVDGIQRTELLPEWTLL